MMGSKYTDAQREQALAMLASGLSPARVQQITGIPRSTIADWRARAEENDEDFVAARREERRKMVNKSWEIVKRGMDGLGAKVNAAKRESVEVEKVVRKILSCGEIDEDTAAKMAKIVREHCGASMTELTRATKEIYEIYNDLDAGLREGADGAQMLLVEFGGERGLAE